MGGMLYAHENPCKNALIFTKKTCLADIYYTMISEV